MLSDKTENIKTFIVHGPYFYVKIHNKYFLHIQHTPRYQIKGK